MTLTPEMIKEIQVMRAETGESLQHCKKVVEDKYAEKERQGMYNLLWLLDIDSDLRNILEYLIRKS